MKIFKYAFYTVSIFILLIILVYAFMFTVLKFNPLLEGNGGTVSSAEASELKMLIAKFDIKNNVIFLPTGDTCIIKEAYLEYHWVYDKFSKPVINNNYNYLNIITNRHFENIFVSESNDITGSQCYSKNSAYLFINTFSSEKSFHINDTIKNNLLIKDLNNIIDTLGSFYLVCKNNYFGQRLTKFNTDKEFRNYPDITK